MISYHGDEEHKIEGGGKTTANSGSSKSNQDKADDTDNELTYKVDAGDFHNKDHHLDHYNFNTNNDPESRLRRRKRSNAENPPLRFMYDDNGRHNVDQEQVKENLPTTFPEAKYGPDGDQWLEALIFLFDSLTETGTWELNKLP